MRALIADDDPTNRLLLSRILARDFDCASTEAENGLEALDLLSRHRYDFVVLDLMMPVLDGLETLAAIRSDTQLSELPVVVMSSIREADLVRQVVRLGVSSYLTKPLRPADLSERMKKFVARLGQSRSAASRVHGDLMKGSRVLVVDGDGDFVHFVKSTIGHEYLVTPATSGAQGLRLLLDEKPALVLLGRELGAVSPAFFMRKLRSLPEVHHTRVISTGHDTHEQAALDVDGAITRTFVPDVFKRNFEGLTSVFPEEVRWLNERPMLRPQLISATEQVMGMMLGWEVSARHTPASPSPDWHSAEVPIHMDGGGCETWVQLVTPVSVAEQMTRAMLAMDDITADDTLATIQEMSNMIAGRILEALRHHGDMARLGLPVVRANMLPSTPGAASRVMVPFGGTQLNEDFSVSVQAVRMTA